MNVNCVSAILLIMIHSGTVYSITKTVKNGRTLTLKCAKPGKLIFIESATFAFKRNKPRKACFSDTASIIVGGLCDGQTECNVVASRATFTDSSCQNNEKEKLQVKYSCVSQTKNPPKTKQGRTQELSCSPGSLIKVSSATYRYKQLCFDPNAEAIVKGLCDGKQSCSVLVDDSIFSDSSCVRDSQAEALSVSYSCKRSFGPAFIHWGGSTCPSGSQIIYSGIMGGAKSTSGYGNGGNYQCLPLSPTYGNFNTTANSNRGAIYVAVFIEATSASNQGILQCAMCQTEEATSLVTLVGTISCPSGWTSLYDGNLVSEKEETTGFVSSKGFECLKLNPDTIANDDTSSTDVSEVHFVEQVCGTLPCASYTTGDEVGCVVCSI